MTKINKNTKIAVLIKKDKKAIDVLTKVSSKFERLRNPILRKLLAGRTTIGHAASIGKCKVEEIAEALEPLGFEFQKLKEEEQIKKMPVPDFVKRLKEADCETLDVREDIEAGRDPLKLIMKVIKKLPDDKILKIINSFEPTPLINVLGKRGYESYIETISPEEVHAFFKLKKEERKGDLNQEMPDLVSAETFNTQLESFGGKVTQVDVSMMEMPMPMVTILEALSALPKDFVLSVQHKRIPVFLFSELKDRNFDYMVYQEVEDDVKLLIFHKK